MKELHAYAFKAIQTAEAFLPAPEVPTPKQVHDFRLALKRLRFIFRLLRHIEPKNKQAKRFEKQIRPLFRAAGKVRELHLFSVLLDATKDTAPESVAHLQEKLRTEAAWAEILFMKEMREFNGQVFVEMDRMLDRTDKSWPPDKLSRAIRKWIRKTVQAWPLTREKLKATDWHELRRQIKLILALHPLMLFKDRYDKDLHIALDDLAERIGEWHDLHQCILWVREQTAERDAGMVQHDVLLDILDTRQEHYAIEFEQAYARFINRADFGELL